MTRGERCALAIERVYLEAPGYRELRILIDRELRWSRMFPRPATDLEAHAREKREALAARGWSETGDG